VQLQVQAAAQFNPGYLSQNSMSETMNYPKVEQEAASSVSMLKWVIL
jgi:hypothetical protein